MRVKEEEEKERKVRTRERRQQGWATRELVGLVTMSWIEHKSSNEKGKLKSDKYNIQTHYNYHSTKQRGEFKKTHPSHPESKGTSLHI